MCFCLCQIWDAVYKETSADKKEIFVTNQQWAEPWRGDQRCISFQGVKESGALGDLDGAAEFVGLEVKDCVRRQTG